MQGFDIVICGGSFVGLTLARALAFFAPSVRIAMVERMALDQARGGAFDSRSAAITASAQAMLEVIGVWPKLAAKAQPILRTELTDTDLETPVRTPLLGLDIKDARDGEPSAYMVENSAFRKALFDSLEDAQGVSWFAPGHIESFAVEDDQVSIALSSGEKISCRLLTAADGQHSALRRMAGIGAVTWPAARKGIVTTVGHELPHNGTAIQHFLPSGPFAILPLTGNRSSIVWTERADEADRLLAADAAAFEEALAKRFGTRFGEIKVLTKPAAYPLTMTLAREFVRPRFALTGDAAHGLHWIAGQGLNHGLKDAAALAETIIDAMRLGLDIGQISVLRRYERWRRFDSATSAFTAASLNRLFSNGSMGLRMLRGAGLRAVDRIAPLKTAILSEAAGKTGTLPKLLRGQAL
jgi:2-octaprenyl-6-methoxyphenol hydroxylase